jgi:hypothetical protein
MKRIFALALIVCVGLECGCGNSAKQTDPQSNPQDVHVPAITGQWTIAFNGGPTVQANLVSIPCSSISTIAGDQPGISNDDGASELDLSCSIANQVTPHSGGVAVGSITSSGADGYEPRNLLVVAVASGQNTVMSIWFTECSANSEGDCYLAPPSSGWDSYFGNSATLTTPSNNFTGSWACSNQGSSEGVSTPCSDQTGTYIATQE